MRMCLGKILLQNPDVLLLDEPTNHLDLDAIQWLEGYVQSLEVPTVIVSHDREFLDQVLLTIVQMLIVGLCLLRATSLAAEMFLLSSSLTFHQAQPYKRSPSDRQRASVTDSLVVILQVCTKIVETERGVATTYRGNYTQAMRQKAEAVAQQYAAYDKWNKEVSKQKDIVRRCASRCNALHVHNCLHDLSRIIRRSR
jgi:ATPase subunit of ABC transporter with duplicated ATPase domains